MVDVVIYQREDAGEGMTARVFTTTEYTVCLIFEALGGGGKVYTEIRLPSVAALELAAALQQIGGDMVAARVTEEAARRAKEEAEESRRRSERARWAAEARWDRLRQRAKPKRTAREPKK